MRRRTRAAAIGQVETLQSFMRKKGLGERQFLAWMGMRGLDISPKYLSDVLNSRKEPGPVLVSLFKNISGVTLVAEIKR